MKNLHLQNHFLYLNTHTPFTTAIIMPKSKKSKTLGNSTKRLGHSAPPSLTAKSDVSLVSSLNEDVIRHTMLFLPIPDAVALSSTCSTLTHSLLDQLTLKALIKPFVPVSILDRISHLPGFDIKNMYRDFAMKDKSVESKKRVAPKLSDFAFAVRVTRNGVMLPWFECVTTNEEHDEDFFRAVRLSFPPQEIETLTFEVGDVKKRGLRPDYKYDILVTDLSSGRGKIAAEFDSDLESQYLGTTGRQYFDNDISPAIYGCLNSKRKEIGKKREGYAQSGTIAITSIDICGKSVTDYEIYPMSSSDILNFLQGIVEGDVTLS